jgi:hypothetical protein
MNEKNGSQGIPPEQHRQKLAKQKANDMLDEGLERSSAYIEGLGLAKRRGRKKMSGMALVAAGY